MNSVLRLQSRNTQHVRSLQVSVRVYKKEPKNTYENPETIVMGQDLIGMQRKYLFRIDHDFSSYSARTENFHLGFPGIPLQVYWLHL